MVAGMPHPESVIRLAVLVTVLVLGGAAPVPAQSVASASSDRLGVSPRTADRTRPFWERGVEIPSR